MLDRLLTNWNYCSHYSDTIIK